jgi:hypothetical protein
MASAGVAACDDAGNTGHSDKTQNV